MQFGYSIELLINPIIYLYNYKIASSVTRGHCPDAAVGGLSAVTVRRAGQTRRALPWVPIPAE